jgi:hypothetical protein
VPDALSSLRSLANTDSPGWAAVVGDGVGVVGDAGRPGDTVLRTVVRATTRSFFSLCGLATRCFGAWIVMLGSEVPPEGVPVCDIAVPVRPHSNSAIDKRATAGPEKWSLHMLRYPLFCCCIF